MTKPAHPALALFKEMFDAVAQQDTVTAPSHYVPHSVFMAECYRRGIRKPCGFIEETEWLDSIGMPEYAHKVIKAHHRSRGTDFSPMEKGQWRLRQKLRSRT